MASILDLSRPLSPEADRDEDIHAWLTHVMLFVSPTVPRLESKEIIFNAILGGNPVVLFLHEYHDQIMTLCTYMADKKPTELAEHLIRLPLICYKYVSEIEPEFERVNQANLEDLKTLVPEYYSKLGIADKESI